MQNRTSKELFELVKGMSKWEKKSFNRYAKRNSNAESLKMLSLFNVLNAMEEYNEQTFTQRIKGIKCRQLPSLKVYLYNQILDSLRIGKKDDSIMLQLHQLMDHATVLQTKGFWSQSLKVLKRLKNLAATYHQLSFLFQALVMERKLELLCGTCTPGQMNNLSKEMEWCSRELSLTGQLSNQSMLIYGWYRRCGILKSKENKEKADEIFSSCCELEDVGLSFYPRLYLLQAKTHYYQVVDEPAHFYQAATEWVAHFQHNPQMPDVEPIQYQRGLFYLNQAAFQYGQAKTLRDTANELAKGSDNFYQLSSALNCRLFEKQVDEELLSEAYLYVQSSNNPGRLLMICWPAANLCFQQANFERAIDFIQVALHQKTDVRIDLQFELRLLQIEAHQQLGNDSLAESLALSTRRFAKTHKLVANVKKLRDG